MQTYRGEIPMDAPTLPAILVRPETPRPGAAVFIHGYGGCKEELLGLAWRVAEQGIVTCVIDLRGHGESKRPLDGHALADVEAAVAHCRQYGPVVAVGHSLGGRLALLSSAAYAIGVSPALSRNFSSATQEKVRVSRSYRVHEVDKEAIFRALRQLPEMGQRAPEKMLLVYGTRDVHEIIALAKGLGQRGIPLLEVPEATHADIFVVEQVIGQVCRQITGWLDAQS